MKPDDNELELLTADQARRTSQFIQKHRESQIMYNLKDVIQEIKAEALKGNSQHIFEEYSKEVDFIGLMNAMRDLGYTVEDFTGTPDHRGGTYPRNSMLVKW